MLVLILNFRCYKYNCTRCDFNSLPHNHNFNSLPDDKFLDCSKLKESADDNFIFDKNGRKISKRVENTVGKEEIAHHEQFLLFPQCFQKACCPEASKVSMCGNWLSDLGKEAF